MTNLEKTVDINQTWRRIFEIGPSPITDWPIQLLCDSHIYKDRRRIVLSSIIKVSLLSYNYLSLLLFVVGVESCNHANNYLGD